MSLNPREWLIEARKRAGLSQVEAAFRTGVSQGAFAQWETGRRKPSRAFQIKIGIVLGDPQIPNKFDLELTSSPTSSEVFSRILL